MKWYSKIITLVLIIMFMSQGCDKNEPDDCIKFTSIPHTLVGVDKTPFNEKGGFREIKVPSEGMLLTFLPTKEYSEQIYVNYIYKNNPDLSSEYPNIGIYDSPVDFQSRYEAGKILASDDNWYEIAYGPDNTIHDVVIDIFPNESGQERVLTIALVCRYDPCREMTIEIIQEPLQK